MMAADAAEKKHQGRMEIAPIAKTGNMIVAGQNKISAVGEHRNELARDFGRHGGYGV